jgi:phosphoserine phosphatase RsbU/P
MNHRPPATMSFWERFQRWSFTSKVLGLLCVGTLLGSLLFAYSTLASHRESLLRSIDRNLTRAAFAAGFIVGADFHDRLFTGTLPTPQEHAQNMRLLTKLTDQMDIHAVYTLIRLDDGFRLTAFNEPLFTGTFGHMGLPGFQDPFSRASEMLPAAFREREMLFEETSDGKRALRTVFLPQTTPSGRMFVIGADIEMSYIHHRLVRLAFHYASQGLLFFFVPFLIVFLLLRRASRHLLRLASLTETWIRSGFQSDPAILDGLRVLTQTHRDEVGEIGKTMLSMYESLERHVDELKRTETLREMADSEMRIARQMQRSILPGRFPPHVHSDRVEVFAHLQPAKGVGGDFFDFIFPTPDRMMIFVGDVSGKGIPAAFFMALVTTVLQTYGRPGFSPR